MLRAALVAALIAAVPRAGAAWFERGHDIIARVAVWRVVDALGVDHPFAQLLLAHQDRLAHLASAPDTVWRSWKTVAHLDHGSHFVSLEDLANPVTIESLPTDIVDAATVACAAGRDLISQTGTAPWRIEQLAELMRAELAAVKTARKPSRHIDAALVYAGLLAHYLGDLANPDHTATKWDGWAFGQGGIHVYFERELVDHQPLVLASDVLTRVREREPANTLGGTRPLGSAFRLAIDSHRQHATLLELDRKYAVVTRSQEKPERVPARRHPPSQVAEHLRPFITARLAAGADLLAAVWLSAWRDVGEPDVSRFQSTGYPATPAFVPVNHLEPLVHLGVVENHRVDCDKLRP